MVLAVSSRIPPVPPYSGYYTSNTIYAYRIFTFSDPTFQLIQLNVSF